MGINLITNSQNVLAGTNVNFDNDKVNALNTIWTTAIGAETALLPTFTNGYQGESVINISGGTSMRVLRGIDFEGQDVENRIIFLHNYGARAIILIVNELSNTQQQQFIDDFDLYLLPNSTIGFRCTSGGLIPISQQGLNDMRYVSTLQNEFYSVNAGNISFNTATGATNTLITGQEAHPYVFAHRSGILLGKACWLAGTPNFGGQNNAIVAGKSTYITFYAVVRVPELIDGTDDFEWRFGFMDNGGISTAGPHGAYFKYSSAFTNWQCITSSTTETVVDSSVLVVDTDWCFMQIRFEPENADYVQFLINGTIVATIATDVPSGTGQEFTVGSAFEKLAGMANRDVYMDYFRMDLVTHKR